MSVTAAWSGWPSQTPFRKSLTGRIGSEQGAQPAVVEVAERPGPAVLGGDEPGEQTGHLPHLPGECIHRLVHIAAKFGDNSRAGSAKFVDKPVVVHRAPARTFRLARRGRCEPPDRFEERSSGRSREPGSRSQGQRARDPATTRDCGLVRSLRTRRTAVPTSSFGRFRVPGAIAGPFGGAASFG